MKARGTIAFVIAAMVLVLASSAMAVSFWVPNGMALCALPNTQYLPCVVSDLTGGTFIAWCDYRDGAQRIYIQHVASNGRALWGTNGVAVCDSSSSQNLPRMIPDGTGGCIVTWLDGRSFLSVYGQRISASGSKLWNLGGVRLLAGATLAVFSWQEISPDGVGGFIIAAMRGQLPLQPRDVLAQRVRMNGTVLWAAAGVPVCIGHMSMGLWGAVHPVGDGTGGAIIAWPDNQVPGRAGLHAQRLDSLGTVLWTPNGVAVHLSPPGQVMNIHLATDGAGGAIIVWQCNGKIQAQRVAPDSTSLWTPGGINVCTEGSAKSNPQIALFDTSGVYVAWQDARSGASDIYGQRIALDSTLRWAASGVPVCAAAGDQTDPQIAEDGSLGVCITWADKRSGTVPYIYAQRVDSTASMLWHENGVAVCKYKYGPYTTGTGMLPALACGIVGSPTIAWVDVRNGDEDIYVQRVNANGYAVWPYISAIVDVPKDQGGKLQVSWDRSYYDCADSLQISHYSLWRRLPRPMGLDASAPLAQTRPFVPLDFKGPAPRFASGGYSWEWIANVPARTFDSYSYMAVSRYDSMGSNSNWQTFMVSAETSNQLIYYDSAVDSGYSVDNLPPRPPESFAGEQEYMPPGLNLTWAPNAEPDLGNYALYRGTSAGFVPSSENRIAAPTSEAYFDASWRWNSGYYYKLAAVDVHGNESKCVLLSPEDVTGAEAPPTPKVSYLSQNFPNPFNPATRIEFGLSERATVSLRIYDAAGRLVRELAAGALPAGRYVKTWDGKDTLGNAVSSGIYFYRLSTASFTQTRKMVLLR